MQQSTCEELHSNIYENADFSPGTIKDAIKEGEEKTSLALKKVKVQHNKNNIHV